MSDANQTTDPALCEHDFEGAVDGRCWHCRIHYFHLPALTPGCSCGNPVYGHDAADPRAVPRERVPEIRIIEGVMVTGPKS